MTSTVIVTPNPRLVKSIRKQMAKDKYPTRVIWMKPLQEFRLELCHPVRQRTMVLIREKYIHGNKDAMPVPRVDVFDKEDWMGWAGATEFANGHPPMICYPNDVCSMIGDRFVIEVNISISDDDTAVWQLMHDHNAELTQLLMEKIACEELTFERLEALGFVMVRREFS